MKTYSAEDVARYFLAKTDPDVGELISNLKLQKLCYYAQGYAAAVRGRGLFDDRVEAWLHGPVVPSLYRLYKSHEGAAIPPVTDLDVSAYPEADRLILDDVYDYFGQYSAWRLREMTHEEAPWKDAYKDGANHEIRVDALASFFAGQLEAGYRDRYATLAAR